MKGLHREKSLENLKQYFGKNAPSRTQVFFWFGEFRQAGEVWMNTGSAHRRPLLRLETSRQRNNYPRSSQGLAFERLRKVFAAERQRPCPYWTIIFVSENDVQGGSPTRWRTNNDGLGLSGTEFMLWKFNEGRSKWTWEALTDDETWIYRYDPETKTVMQSAVWPSSEESPPPKLKK